MMNRTGLPISGLPNPALQNPVYPPPMQGIGQPSSPVACMCLHCELQSNIFYLSFKLIKPRNR